MARKAIASTLAAVVLLTVLVAADITTLAAEDNVASAALTSRLESRELLLKEATMGGLAMELLAQAQQYLSTSPAECASIQQYLESVSASSSTSGVDSGIAFSGNGSASGASPAYLAGAPEPDNLTLVSPFSGAVPGALDLEASLTINEVGGGGSVSLSKAEDHVLNIPIEASSAQSLCASSLSSLQAAFSSVPPCNATLAAAAFRAVLPGLVGYAASYSFSLTAGWYFGQACVIEYWITLVEPEVAGPTGSFDWTVDGSGEA